MFKLQVSFWRVNIQYITSDISNWHFALHLKSCCPYMSVLCTVLIKLSICLSTKVTYTHCIVNLAIKGILINTATVNPCQDQVALLSNIVGYVELDKGHSSAALISCFYKFGYKNALTPNVSLDWIFEGTFCLSCAYSVCELSLSKQNVSPFVYVLRVEGQSLCLI